MNVKQTAIRVIRSLRKQNVTKYSEYRDKNGLMCFNGHIGAALGFSPLPPNGLDFLIGLEDSLSLPVKGAINSIHFGYIRGEISFTEAKKQVLEVLNDIPS